MDNNTSVEDDIFHDEFIFRKNQEILELGFQIMGLE